MNHRTQKKIRRSRAYRLAHTDAEYALYRLVETMAIVTRDGEVEQVRQQVLDAIAQHGWTAIKRTSANLRATGVLPVRAP